MNVADVLRADVTPCLRLRQAVCADEPAEVGANRKFSFHFSRLKRRREVERWRKRRKIEWMKKM